ncbi:MAG TPA: LuxR C-terminal-related transcriptional regulator [Thermomicrobiales bacterium]|nr:LuxR C-terminal-related transcriptional regulator [Thermomicrobiales bacterium]
MSKKASLPEVQKGATSGAGNGEIRQLPVPLSPFLGREADIAQVLCLLDDPAVRLLSLTGPGGVGKTRLAIEVAEEARHAFADGVIFVPLAAVRDPELVLPAIAQAVGVRETAGDQLSALVHAAMANREMLLLLDNFEHVIPAAPVVARLLSHCPKVTVLSTSRERLHLSGEHEYPVAPLQVVETSAKPSLDEIAGSDAILLFVSRAQSVKPEFTLTENNGSAIADICRRLDGLPLAIELAAARIKVLPPAALRARLEHALPILTDGSRDLPAHQQTMRTTIAWSYDLLSLAERLFFQHLAVFVGGFTLKAFETVCGDLASPELDALTALTSLVDKSLVRVVEVPDGTARYLLLETVREFALERLRDQGSEFDARAAHAVYFRDLAERLEAEMYGPAMHRCLDRFDEEMANMRSALTFFAEAADAGSELRLAGMMAEFWDYRGFIPEGIDRLSGAIARGRDAPPRPRAKALFELALLYSMVGDTARADEVSAESLPVAREDGDRYRLAMALYVRAECLRKGGSDRWDEVIELLEEAVAHAGCFDPPPPIWGPALGELGRVLTRRGERQRGTALIHEAVEVQRSMGQRFGAGLQLATLARLDREAGNLTQAAVRYGESLRLFSEDGVDLHIAGSVAGLARLAAARGWAEHAALLLGAVDAVAERTGATAQLAGEEDLEWIRETANGALGAERFTAAIVTGRQLPFAAAVAAALALAETLAQDADLPAAIPSPVLLPFNVPPTPARFGLTPREQEVLGLLIKGKSNPEIAKQLFISPRTATTHVTNILAKFGVETRAAAVAFAFQHNLV